MAAESSDLQIRVIVLNSGAHQSSLVLRLRKGWIVRFVKGTRLLGRSVLVTTSLSGVAKWKDNSDDVASYADVVCSKSGGFSYKFYVNGVKECAGSGCFFVEPELRAGQKSVPLNGIACLSHFSTLLGPFPDWPARLCIARESGYNMLHFTPVQALSTSGNVYSVSDPSKLNPAFNTPDKQFSLGDVGEFINRLANEWGVLSIQDVVWDRAAKNADWLMKHPECSFNIHNSPHLRPAYVLDRAYYHFGREVASGKWSERNMPSVIETRSHAAALRDVLLTEIVPNLKICEFFKADVDQLSKEFAELAKKGPVAEVLNQYLPLIPGREWKRFGFTVDMDRALKIFNRTRSDTPNEEDRQRKCMETFRTHLNHLNRVAEDKWEDSAKKGIQMVIDRVTWERVDDKGPRIKPIDDNTPLFTQYFLHTSPSTSWEEDEKASYDPANAARLMAFCGKIVNDDPLKDYAVYPSQAYLQRQLVSSSDCVKLRYGEKPEDCPFLYSVMKEYSQSCAKAFHGISIIDCQNVPIHASEYLVSAAREVRPDLLVAAEVTTRSEHLDNIFVNRLGINFCVIGAQREVNCHTQGRLVGRFTGGPIGDFMQDTVREAIACVPCAFLCDQCLDGLWAVERRSLYDFLPTAAMLAMANCATASARGYDEVFSFKVDAPKTKQLYSRWTDESRKAGIVAARNALNKLHTWLAVNKFTQQSVDQMNGDIVAITRHSPVTHEEVVLVAHTAFNKRSVCLGRPAVRHLYFEGIVKEVIFEAGCTVKSPWSEVDSSGELRGIREFAVELREHIPPSQTKLVTIHGNEGGHVEFNNFIAGSVIALRFSPPNGTTTNSKKLRKFLSGEDGDRDRELHGCLNTMSLQSFNRLLYRCDEEERCETGGGTYVVPNYGPMMFCGLQGLMPLLKTIRTSADLGHPLCYCIRDGDSLCDYLANRLKGREGTRRFGAMLDDLFAPIKGLQRALKPAYFDAVVSRVYSIIEEQLFEKLNPSVSRASALVRTLVVSSVAFVGALENAPLAPLSRSVPLQDRQPSSLAAGFPYIAISIYRNWGRDTFISLPGCLLIPGRFADAKCLILSYAGSLRHGLIPNLLIEGKFARYSCRDAVWWWLLAITKYIDMAPNGDKILHEKVVRLFPKDDSIAGKESKEEELHLTMLEALQRHFEGIEFRERNAGRELDNDMNDAGFNVTARVDRQTGFVLGGNEWNCGTWMNKMGSSDAAGNRGIPSTPRDGAAVELQGILFHVLEALHKLHAKGTFPHPGVSHGSVKWTWTEWASLLQKNFERCFFVGDDDRSPLVHRRGILKDCYTASAPYTDYQLRPNFAITLTLAPRLMSAENAWRALKLAEEVLLGPLGIKTLDPKDVNYCGFYNVLENSNVKKTAQGFNFHQGPEWLWVAMYFMRAKLLIAEELKDNELCKQVRHSVRARLGAYWEYMQKSPWVSLPAFTNENGAFCSGACGARAWSVGCLIELLDQLYKLH